MKALSLEIDQTLQQLDASTASRLERLVRDAIALVKPVPTADAIRNPSLRFPLVQGAKPITNEDVSHHGLTGHRQITDAWLAELARQRGGKLATLDSGLAAFHPDVAELI